MKLDYKVGKIEHLPSALDSSSLLHAGVIERWLPQQGVINYLIRVTSFARHDTRNINSIHKKVKSLLIKLTESLD